MTFLCEKCRIELGEMTKGKIKKGTILLCDKCWGSTQLKESADKLSNLTGNNNIMNILKDIIK